MKVIPLSEGSFTIDSTKIFVPYNKQTDDMDERSSGSLLVEVQPFVVICENDIILLDTGLGFNNANGNLQIHDNLLAHGIKKEDITKVLLSHLHKDHAGGISYESEHEVLSFPNAMYYISRKEMDYAFQKGKPSYYPENFALLSKSDRLVFLNDSVGSINEQIRYEIAGGHCPYHTVYWICEGEDTVFFGADVASQLQQMKSRFIAKYDHDGKKSMQLRKQWWGEAKEKKWKLLFYHDIKIPFQIPS